MKAVIVAGGFGKRLRPLTDNIPKPLVEFNSKPIMQHQIEWLKKYNIKEILVTVCYKHDKIIDYFGDGSKYGVKLKYFIEDKPLGTAGAIILEQNKKWLDDDFIVVYGDVITNLNIDELLDYHNSKKSILTMVVNRGQSLSSAVKLDKNNSVISFVEKPKEIQKNMFINSSIYLINKDLKNMISGRIPLDFSTDLFPELITKGFPIFAFINERYYFREVGTIEKLDKVKKETKKAIFLDIDGILCEKAKWGEYIDSIEKFKWLPKAKDLIIDLAMNGFYIFAITNKACINKGFVTDTQIKEMYDKVFENLPINEVYVCPHKYDEECDCRKPKPGLIIKGLLKYNLKPENCWVIGDNDVDIVSGEKAGCKTILVGTNGINKLPMNPDFMVKDIGEIVKVCDGDVKCKIR
jgi:mannose-1-phosphate guanylyltransferase/phosphomannomutase